MPIQNELRRILEQRETLSREEASALMESILAGQASDIELAALLGALAARGETSAEIAGFATSLRKVANLLPLSDIEQQRPGRHLWYRRRRQRQLQHLHRRRPGRRRAAGASRSPSTAIAPSPPPAAPPTSSKPSASPSSSPPPTPPQPSAPTASPSSSPPRITLN